MYVFYKVCERARSCQMTETHIKDCIKSPEASSQTFMQS